MLLGPRGGSEERAGAAGAAQAAGALHMQCAASVDRPCECSASPLVGMPGCQMRPFWSYQCS